MIKTSYALLLLCTAFQAFASPNLYINLGGALTLPAKNTGILDNSSYVIYGPTSAPSGVSIFNLPNVNWQNKYKTGFNLNCALGYSFVSNWRSDIEFLYQRIKRKVVGTYDFIEYDAVSTGLIESKIGIPVAPSTGYANVYSILTNFYYDFMNSHKWRPLLGGGFGIAWINAYSTTAEGGFISPLGSATTTLQHSPKLSGSALALQFKTGVTYAWFKTTSLVLQYRLFVTSNFIANKSSIITNPNSGASSRTFIVNQQTVHGILTNSFEVIFKFDL